MKNRITATKLKIDYSEMLEPFGQQYFKDQNLYYNFTRKFRFEVICVKDNTWHGEMWCGEIFVEKCFYKTRREVIKWFNEKAQNAGITLWQPVFKTWKIRIRDNDNVPDIYFEKAGVRKLRWKVYIVVNGRRKFIAYCKTKEDAVVLKERRLSEISATLFI